MSAHKEQTIEETPIPIACNLSGQEQEGRQDEVLVLLSSAEQIEELEDGYAFRYPTGEDWATRLTAFIISERRCCPFFSFELLFQPNDGPIWLRLRGPEGTREFIKDGLIGAANSILK